MDPEVQQAMELGGIADITTIGRKSGLDRKIEIYFHHFDGAYYLLGQPTKKDWLLNIKANPQFTLHVKRGITGDVAVIGETDVDADLKRDVIVRARVDNWGHPREKGRSRAGCLGRGRRFRPLCSR